MKKSFFLLLSAILITLTVNSSVVYAQLPATTLRVIKTAKVNDSTVTFEVWFKNVSASSIEYAAGQYFWDFNKAYLNGIATLSILSSGLTTAFQPENPTVYTDSTPCQFRFASNSTQGAGNGQIIPAGDSVMVMKVSINCHAGFASAETLNMVFRKPTVTPYTNITSYIGTTNAVITSNCTFFDDVPITTELCKDVSFISGWNIFGVPVNASDMTVAALLPSATSQVYGYNGRYTIVAAVVPSKGYWVRYPNAAIKICGTQVSQLTVALSEGWNIISAYENDVPVSAFTTTPAGIINSLFYGFNNGYSTATSLQSGKGYWVRASAAGVLTLSAALFKNVSAAAPVIDSKWSSVRLSDAAGNKSSLYFSTAAQDLSKYQLPPVPPSGIFDARFASQSLVENLDSPAKVISISSATYPVEVQAEGIDLLIKDKVTGKLINKIVKAGSSIVISNENITSIEVSKITKPLAYELLQNYPNPFNPATIIRFGLPDNAYVRLTIYNQIGEQVANLVNGPMEAGYHEITWNALNMSSGVYFYQIHTEKFKSVKKLLLMK